MNRELSATARSTWKAATDQPLRLIISDVWLGGALVAYIDRKLAVLVDGERARDMGHRGELECGELVVQDHANTVPGVAQWLERAPLHGEWILNWASSRGPERLRSPSTIALGRLPSPGRVAGFETPCRSAAVRPFRTEGLFEKDLAAGEQAANKFLAICQRKMLLQGFVGMLEKISRRQNCVAVTCPRGGTAFAGLRDKGG